MLSENNWMASYTYIRWYSKAIKLQNVERIQICRIISLMKFYIEPCISTLIAYTKAWKRAPRPTSLAVLTSKVLQLTASNNVVTRCIQQLWQRMQLISPRQSSLYNATGIADQTCGSVTLYLVPGDKMGQWKLVVEWGECCSYGSSYTYSKYSHVGHHFPKH